jgi:hypothetical protein
MHGDSIGLFGTTGQAGTSGQVCTNGNLVVINPAN